MLCATRVIEVPGASEELRGDERSDRAPAWTWRSKERIRNDPCLAPHRVGIRLKPWNFRATKRDRPIIQESGLKLGVSLASARIDPSRVGPTYRTGYPTLCHTARHRLEIRLPTHNAGSALGCTSIIMVLCAALSLLTVLLELTYLLRYLNLLRNVLTYLQLRTTHARAPHSARLAHRSSPRRATHHSTFSTVSGDFHYGQTSCSYVPSLEGDE